MKRSLFLFGILFCTMAFFSCSSTKVERVDDDTDIDLSGYWNDSDIRKVCEDLIAECTSSPRVAGYKGKNGNLPTVIIGKIRNRSDEHIDTKVIANKIQTAIINDGKLNFVASAEERQDLRAERLDQADNASVETQAEIGNETGADLMMQGYVECVVDSVDNKMVRKYTVTLSMLDMSTNINVWQNQASVRKFIKRAKYKM